MGADAGPDELDEKWGAAEPTPARAVRYTPKVRFFMASMLQQIANPKKVGGRMT